MKRQNDNSAGARVSRTEIGGRAVWLKNFAEPSPPKWAALQRAAFVVLRLDLLKPIPTRGGPAGAAAEAAAMERFRAVGAPVPEVISIRDALLTISDLGPTLRDIERRAGSAAIAAPVSAAARELSRLHGLGLVHGRPILRNLTWDGKIVGFIDFEEEPLQAMSADAAAARDILLLLMSVGRRGSGAAVDAAFAAYAPAMRPGVMRQLLRVVALGRPLTGRVGQLLMRSGNRDVIGLVHALRALRTLRSGSAV